HDARIAIGMVNRGDDQHDIAAWFGVNQARIAEALQGKYGTTEAAPVDQLPPKGPPGVKGRRLRAFVDKAIDALNSGNTGDALKALKDGVARYEKSEA